MRSALDDAPDGFHAETNGPADGGRYDPVGGSAS
jgi:hypothetical protein